MTLAITATAGSMIAAIHTLTATAGQRDDDIQFKRLGQT
jgi:hypothetical protein